MNRSRYSCFFLLLISFITSSAQKNTPMQGEYYLRGVMETASGFKLNPDSTFEFFFSYGALDRYGSGRWKQLNGNIIFDSRPQPGKDFALIKSEKVPGDITTIRIMDSNKMILQYVDAIVKYSNSSLEESADDEGIISIPKHSPDSIALLFRLCPDRFSNFHVTDKSHNYFEFKFEPWIAEVFFKDFKLKVEDKNKLSGKHPLLTDESYLFVKESD
jgi:hypothetical protein